MKKSLISLGLAVILLCSLLSPSALAASPAKLTLSTNSISLFLDGDREEQIICSLSGDLPSKYGIRYDFAGSGFVCSWGAWEGRTVPLKVTATARGGAELKIRLYNKQTGQVLDTETVDVEIKSGKSPLAAPKPTASNSAESGKVRLSWSEVSGAVKYEIYRASSKNGSYTKMYTTTNTSYTNTTAKSGSTYYYKLRAIDADGDRSGYSEIVSRTCDLAAPDIDARSSSGSPKLGWAAVDGADSYVVYRASSRNGSYTRMFTTGNTSYTNTTAKSGYTYYYKVVAQMDESGSASSAYSNIVSIKAN